MRDPGYWKRYVVEADADEIEAELKAVTFTSGGRAFELIHFERGKREPNILISPGSGGHGYVFAELGYRMYARGYNVFIMPKHGPCTVTQLMQRHRDALGYIAGSWNNRIGVFGEGLGGFVTFYLALAHASLSSIVCQNSPAILSERAYHEAILQGKGAARRRRVMFPL